MILHSASQVLVAHLIAVGVLKNPASAPDWSGYFDFMPENPTNAVCIYNTTGGFEIRPMDGSARVERPGYQVVIRSKLYNPAFLKYGQIVAALDAIYKTTVVVEAKNYEVHAIKRTTPFLPLGMEEGGSRLLFSTNGIVNSYGEK